MEPICTCPATSEYDPPCAVHGLLGIGVTGAPRPAAPITEALRAAGIETDEAAPPAPPEQPAPEPPEECQTGGMDCYACSCGPCKRARRPVPAPEPATFREYCDAAAREVASWPAWKQAAASARVDASEPLCVYCGRNAAQPGERYCAAVRCLRHALAESAAAVPASEPERASPAHSEEDHTTGCTERCREQPERTREPVDPEPRATETFTAPCGHWTLYHAHGWGWGPGDGPRRGDAPVHERTRDESVPPPGLRIVRHSDPGRWVIDDVDDAALMSVYTSEADARAAAWGYYDRTHGYAPDRATIERDHECARCGAASAVLQEVQDAIDDEGVDIIDVDADRAHWRRVRKAIRTALLRWRGGVNA